MALGASITNNYATIQNAGTGWTTPANIVGATPSDNNYATVSNQTSTNGQTIQTSSPIVVSGFDFSSIPVGATINGVTVQIEAKSNNATKDTGGHSQNRYYFFNNLFLTTDGSTKITGTDDKGSDVFADAIGESESFISKGGASDTWGGITRSHLTNANFGVYIRPGFYCYGAHQGDLTTACLTGTTLSIDSVRVSVDYTPICQNPHVINVSSPNSTGTYGVGEHLYIDVQYNETVTTTGTVGVKPLLDLNSDNINSDDDAATYSSVNGDTVRFLYVIKNGEATTQLDYETSTPITLSGSTITRSTDPACQVLTTFPNPGLSGSLSSNVQLKVDTPAGRSTETISTSAGTVTVYTLGGSINAQYNFLTDNVNVDYDLDANNINDFTYDFLFFRVNGVGNIGFGEVTYVFPQDLPTNIHIYKAIPSDKNDPSIYKASPVDQYITSGTLVDITDKTYAVDGIEVTGLQDGDNEFTIKIKDSTPGNTNIYDLNDSNGVVEDPVAPVIATPISYGRECAGDCYSPHMGVDKNGKVFYDDGLKINDHTFRVDNVLHNSPDTILTLPVGQPVFVTIKAQDSWANQIKHCELGVGIPHGIFDKSLASFLIGVDRDFDGTNVTPKVTGDTSALSNLAVSFVNTDDQTAVCNISFIPTKHLENDMFSVEVWDIYQYSTTYYFNHGIEFKGESLVGTPVYEVMDQKGLVATIAIIDKTLEDLTKAVDTQGNTWSLIDGFWTKDFISNDLTCDPKQGRHCIEFQHKIQEQRELAKKYFDSSLIKKDAPKSFTKDMYGVEHIRGKYQTSMDMQHSIATVQAH